ncbi:tyrosine-protein phosphatase [Hydrogenophaga sp. BPS33]|uniref:tyrosine-protein phosphatase n=1 Tax=Hydrogenophaga sp. BPS33 TaxID=2651974 RepID=UPI00131F62E4|nr:tyrosine-protein phosphatase [Hydrogenophaga sp. BPS33]QHE85654.1 tyrosine-protein phosphatase [Hydrogenophaga sp. BPS33]
MTPASHSAPHRLLPSASNFRDLGGHVGADGRRVRRGRVYRSDHLAGLTATDLQTLQGLGLTHRIDFRGTAECAALPCEIAGIVSLPLSIEPTVVQRVLALVDEGTVPTEAQAVALMCDTYRGFVREGAPVYARFFRHFVEHPTPVVFHCTAGKDRTGFGAALLLGALGVAREDIVQDYLLTNQFYQRSPLVQARGPAHVMDVLWSVRPAFLEAAFDAIEQDFGSLERYLQGPMGLGPREQAQLRASLLES